MNGNNNIIIIVVIGVILLIAIYLYNNGQVARKAADAAIIASTPAPVCVPFTKSQQDAQKKELNKICAKKQFIPVVGVFQFTDCLAKVDGQLTPIKSC